MCVLLAFFKIGVTENDGLDGRILDLGVRLRDRHPANIEVNVLDGWIALSQRDQSR